MPESLQGLLVLDVSPPSTISPLNMVAMIHVKNHCNWYKEKIPVNQDILKFSDDELLNECTRKNRFVMLEWNMYVLFKSPP